MAKVELKQPIVDEIKAQLDGAKSMVVVDYRGISVADVTELRKQCREAGVVYKVYKNTMVKRAVEGTEFEGVVKDLEGTNAFAISKEDAELPKKKYKEKLEVRAKKYPSVSYEIADQINQTMGSEVRVTVPGHIQRGGEPCPYDRVLSTRIGAGAAEAILDGEYGIMIGVINGKIKRVPLADCAGKLKMVSPKDQIVKAAKQIGISFGD